MRSRKGTKTENLMWLNQACYIYKDETPEGDENHDSLTSSRYHTQIYKDETPEGDENRIDFNCTLTAFLFIKMRPRKGTKTINYHPFTIGFSIYKDETPEGDENKEKRCTESLHKPNL